MKKFLVTFVDALTGRSQEQVVEGKDSDTVKQGFIGNLKQVLKVVAL